MERKREKIKENNNNNKRPLGLRERIVINIESMKKNLEEGHAFGRGTNTVNEKCGQAVWVEAWQERESDIKTLLDGKSHSQLSGG